MVIKVLPDALAGIDGLTSEEVSDMLGTEVDKLAGVVANTASSGITFDLYDHYTITQRDPMDPGEGLMIVPANRRFPK